MSITVVIPTYNRAELLQQALDGFHLQSLKPSQIIVVDDGSTDSTSQLANVNPGVLFLRKKNGGKSTAINFALPHILSDYTWIFDDDDVPFADAVERLVKALDAHSACGYAFGTYLSQEGKGSKLGSVLGESSIPQYAGTAPFVALMESCYIPGATLMARTSCYREVGGFDVRRRRSQDYHMALSIAQRWNGVRVEGGPLFRRREHSGLRGAADHQVAPVEVGKNHRMHDAEIMRELVASLPLEAFLPRGVPLAGAERLARLQRISVLTIHRVYPELVERLTEFAEASSGDPFNQDELDVLERLVAWTNGLATGDLRFVEAMAAASRHRSIRRLRAGLLRILTRRIVGELRDVRRASKLAWRTSWLLPGFIHVARRRQSRAR